MIQQQTNEQWYDFRGGKSGGYIYSFNIKGKSVANKNDQKCSETFDVGQEMWLSYIECFELFCECNKVKADRKVCTLTIVGIKTYTLWRSLYTQEKPSSKGFKDIVKIIQSHLYPKPSLIVECYKFSKRNQLENQSISEYIASLKRLSIIL